MGAAKLAFVLCVAAICFTKGESRRICGLEVEYRGYDPLEALKIVQERQIQEFVQFRKLLRQLKFKLQTEDYLAWKRCLKEYDAAKRSFINNALRVKLSFQGQLKSLTARNLAAEQYQTELQNLMNQFQTEFTPSVESFHTNIKNLFDTIQDEKRRKQWWSTVKTTQISTGPDGSQTRTSITQTSSGIGGKETGYSKTAESNSISGGMYGAASSVMSKTKIGTTVMGGSGGNSNSGNDYEKDIDEDSDNDEGSGKGNQKSEKYTSQSQEMRSGDNYGSGSESKYSAQNQEVKSGANYGASGFEKKGSGYQSESKYSNQNQEVKSGGNYGSGSGYQATQVSKESKESSYKAAGSFSDNSQINFSQTQSRSGLKEGYGTSGYSAKEEKKSGYTATSQGYRRRRRTLGLLAGALGGKRSGLKGGSNYGSDYNNGGGGVGGGAGMGVSVGVGMGVGAGGSSGGGFGVGSEASAKAGFGAGGGGVGGGSGRGIGGGYGNQGAGFQGGSNFESKASISGDYNQRSSMSGDYNANKFADENYNGGGGKYSKTIQKEKYQETQMSMKSGGGGVSGY